MLNVSSLGKTIRCNLSLDRMNNDVIITSFVIIAISLRLIFWLYTDRIWEDALISLNPAKNLWEGHGLTHHIPEPRVYSFTSALGTIVLIIGEGLHHPIAFDRILGLIAAGFAIYFAARTLHHYRVGPLGQIVCLSYLSTNHLQIFFGMSGMETQIATAIALGVVWATVTERLALLGIFAGLAALTRPEFLLLDAVFLVYALIRWRTSALPPILIALALFLPWIIFTWIYYGSPIPNTIIVKSGATGYPNYPMMLQYAANIWKHFAPFEEFWFVIRYPGPAFFPGLVIAIVACLAIFGLYSAIFNNMSAIILVVLVVAGFSAYMIRFCVNPYFMWYTPPFSALFFLVVATGIDYLRKRAYIMSYALGAIVIIGYAVHLPFTLVLDKRFQREVEIAVRDRVGARLALLMRPGDSVYLEPLGYIGLHVRDREIYDNPGLGSKIAYAALHKFDLRGISVLSPTFVVMRPGEIERTNREFSGVLDDYETVDHIVGSTGNKISFGGLAYKVGDNEFYILKRKTAPVEASDR